MNLASLPTLLLATLLASPALWHAFVTGQLDYEAALTRYLIAVPIAALMLALLRAMSSGYRRDEAASGPRRRRTDEVAPDAS